MRLLPAVLIASLCGCPGFPEELGPPGWDDDDVADDDDDVEPFVVCINEFMPDNTSGPRDETDEWADWIELHNPTDADVSLRGMRLSDDAEEPDKHVFGDVTLAAGGFLLLWADGDVEEGPNHLPFGLASDGGTVTLFDGAGRGSIINYDAVGPDMALARAEDCCLEDCIAPVPGGSPGWSNVGDGDVVFVRRGDFWTWTIVDPGPGWTAADHDDGSWTGGTAPLGFGDWHIETDIDPPITLTTWFRADFQGPDEVFRSLRVDLLRDAGAAVHLNGTEILRSNLPTGPLDASTRARRGVDGQEEIMYFPFEVDPGLLVEGRNQLAVELHLANPGSADQGFDLALIGRR
jgi:hypothetical protein